MTVLTLSLMIKSYSQCCATKTFFFFSFSSCHIFLQWESKMVQACGDNCPFMWFTSFSKVGSNTSKQEVVGTNPIFLFFFFVKENILQIATNKVNSMWELVSSEVISINRRKNKKQSNFDYVSIYNISKIIRYDLLKSSLL